MAWVQPPTRALLHPSVPSLPPKLKSHRVLQAVVGRTGVWQERGWITKQAQFMGSGSLCQRSHLPSDVLGRCPSSRSQEGKQDRGQH